MVANSGKEESTEKKKSSHHTVELANYDRNYVFPLQLTKKICSLHEYLAVNEQSASEIVAWRENTAGNKGCISLGWLSWGRYV